MESQYEEYYQVVEEPPAPKKNNMAIASMVMGILSLVLGCCCMGTIFGVLAILFACLSKTESKFETKARAGLIMGILGIVLTIVITIAAMFMSVMDTTQWFEMVRAIIQTKYLA